MDLALFVIGMLCGVIGAVIAFAFCVGAAAARAEALRDELIAAPMPGRFTGTVEQAANDPRFLELAAEMAAPDLYKAPSAAISAQAAPTPQPPRSDEIPAFLLRPKCRACYQIRRFFSKSRT